VAATAQTEAWVGAYRGSIDKVGLAIDVSLGDAALGRMMLQRRRAIAASTISEFLARVGKRFAPYLDGRAPWAPSDPGQELANAKAAGVLAEDVAGASPPLLFERALLAETEGRLADAEADLRAVLAAYPGFVAAALAAARVALAAGDPGWAIRCLAGVEREVTHTREGAALLADAVRALGLHEAASRYDLAALTCRGAYDSRGNDCSPVDLMGKVANDDRMPQIFYFESQPDGSVIANARGIYYRMNPLLSRLLLILNAGSLSTFRSLGVARTSSRSGVVPEIFEATIARLRLWVGPRFSGLQVLLWLLNGLAAALGLIFAAALHAIAAVSFGAMIFLYRSYRRLPVPIRASANRHVFLRIKRLLRDLRLYGRRGLTEISEKDARLRLAQTRYQLGLARIFGLRMLPVGSEETNRSASASQRRISNPDDAGASPDIGGLQMPAPNQFPPLAEDVLRRLASEAGIPAPWSLQSRRRY
jgi:hypothetical protein